MRYSTRFLTLVFSLALWGCAHDAPIRAPEVRIETAPVAVAVGCVVDRPDPVVPLNQRMTRDEWVARAPGAKAEAIKAQAGRRLNYEDAERAATGRCPDAPSADQPAK